MEAAAAKIVQSPDPGLGHTCTAVLGVEEKASYCLDRCKDKSPDHRCIADLCPAFEKCRRLNTYEQAGIVHHKHTRVSLVNRRPFGCWTCGLTHRFRMPVDARADPLPPGYYEVVGLTSKKGKQYNGKIGTAVIPMLGERSCRPVVFVPLDDRIRLRLKDAGDTTLLVKRRNIVSVIDKAPLICRGCRKARYCSPGCQERGWGQLEHSKMCSSILKMACVSRKGFFSAPDAADLEPEPALAEPETQLAHPCPICNVRWGRI